MEGGYVLITLQQSTAKQLVRPSLTKKSVEFFFYPIIFCISLGKFKFNKSSNLHLRVLRSFEENGRSHRNVSADVIRSLPALPCAYQVV